MSFVHLHAHSSYSILDGAGSVEKMVRRAAELGQPALALTDHGSLSGAYDLWKYGTQYGVRPIIGLEAYVSPGARTLKEPVVWGELEGKKVPSQGGAYTHMTLWATSAEGVRNLYRLQHRGYVDGYYFKPRVDLELLDAHSRGISASTGCMSGAVSTWLRLGERAEADRVVESLSSVFQGRLYVEIMDHDIPLEKGLNQQLLDVARVHNLPLVLTNDAHYVNPEDSTAQDALLCVQRRAQLSDPNRFKFNGTGYHLKSYDEMAKLFPDHPDSITNTLLIAESVESYDELFEKRDMMPASESPYSLREICYERISYHPGEAYSERLDYELDIIERLDFENYFLVLADIVSWAREQHILVGPGRGSAGGSLVAYLLGITELDPLRHGLLFERFLNPSRVSPPDIDVDFQDDRRDEVIRYAVETYGEDRVAQIITFGTIKARAAVKDANRVLGGSYAEGEKLVSFVPPDIRGRQHPLEGLTKLREANEEVYDLALGLEGMIRSTGKHAAGIIISPEPLPDRIPVQKGPKDDVLVASYSQEVLEALGYHKLDLLGLKELSIIDHTLRLINDEEGSTGAD